MVSILLLFSGKKPSPDMKEGLAKSFVLAFNAYLLPPSKEKKPWVCPLSRFCKVSSNFSDNQINLCLVSLLY